MNWYKQAQLDFKWKNFIATFGITAVLGLAALWGVGLLDLRKAYEQNPQKVEQALEQTKEDVALAPENAPTEKTITPSPPEKEVEPKSQGIDIAKMIERHEGKRNSIYYVENIPHIGIGFNLNREDAAEKLKGVGSDLSLILSGQQELTDEQIYSLFKEDLEIAIIDARKFLPNFDQQPTEMQAVLINMSFNMGYPTLSGFVNFRQALLNKNYQVAADEMIDSKWYGQVGNRSKELVSIVKGL